MTRLLLARVGVFRLLRLLLLSSLVTFGIGSRTKSHVLDIRMEADIPVAATAQVFFSFDGLSYYAENNRVLFRRTEDGKNMQFIQIRTVDPIKTLRIDPLNQTGSLDWRSLRIEGNSGVWEGRGATLKDSIRDVDQLTFVGSSAESLRLESTGIDPKMVMDVPSQITRLPASERLWSWLMAVFWGVLVAVAVEPLILLFRKDHPFSIRVRQMLVRTAQAVSDPAVLKVPSSAVAVYCALAILSALWVGGKLHFSSISMWDGMFPPEHVDRAVDIGVAKPIRSDEWGTLTPWILNQALTGMKNDNANIGAPGSPMLAGAPVLSPVMLAQPKYWGFVLLDVERGFSWYWAYKSFGLIAAFFTLLLLLTKGDTVVSLGGALGMFGSSYIQWWYSSVPSETITGFSMAVVGTVYLFRASRPGGMWFGAVLAALSVPNMLLQLYPPYLVVLAYLAAFLLMALLWNADTLDRVRHRLGLRSALIVFSALLTAALVLSWYGQVKDAAQVMMNTAYPGKRANLGGDYPWYSIFYGVFESWKIDDSVTPFPPVNPSEASNFWALFPLALLLFPWNRWRQPALRPVIALLLFCALNLAWTSLPLPDMLKQVMAHTGWSMVPAYRTQIGFAVASALVFALLVGATARGELQLVRVPSIWVSGAAVLLTVGYGLFLRKIDPVFFGDGRIALGAGAVGLLIWAAQRGWRWLYFLVMVAAAAPTMYVNPVQNGLDSFLNKRIFLEAKRLGGSASDKWAVFGNMRLAQGFRGVGLQVINGTYYSPRADLLASLDPDSRYQSVWNRYAHMEIQSGLAGEIPKFDLMFADHFRVKIDVCGPHIRAAGVTRLAFTYVPTASEQACLEPLLVNDYSGVNLYRLRALN